MKAIVNFRTLANGAYSYIKRGQRRGYWRVLLVHDENGSTSVNSHNVARVLWTGAEGIDGVTPRSSYYIGGFDGFDHAMELAAAWNVEQILHTREMARADDEGMIAA